MRRQRASLQNRRTRSFLVAQSTLLVIGAAFAMAGNLSGFMTDVVFYQSITFCVICGIVTALGWHLFNRRGVTTSMVVGLLYVDSVIGLFFLYVAGEFEITLGVLTFPIIMAPIYAAKRHTWGLAIFQSVIYVALVTCRQYGVLPYGEMLPIEAVTQPAFVADSVVSFLIVTFGVAFLAGQASIDILTSQKQLENEVDQRTRALSSANAGLRAATRSLEAVNRELEERNEQLRAANLELRSSNTALAQFNTAVSHDLRTPLQTMRSNLEMLEMTAAEAGSSLSPQVLSRRLERIAGSVDRMTRLIDELRKLSRISSRLGEMRPVDMNDVIQDAVVDLEARIHGAGGEVEAGPHLPTVLGNRSLVKEVLQNLLDNAIKYGDPHHPRIRVVPAPAPCGRAAVAVEDNGEGIDPADQDYVFRLFSRLQEHERIEGMGAGLAIVERIVQVHGGTVRIERSRSLGGARFVVELKVASPAAEAPPDEVASSHAAP